MTMKVASTASDPTSSPVQLLRRKPGSLSYRDVALKRSPLSQLSTSESNEVKAEVDIVPRLDPVNSQSDIFATSQPKIPLSSSSQPSSSKRSRPANITSSSPDVVVPSAFVSIEEQAPSSSTTSSPKSSSSPTSTLSDASPQAEPQSQQSTSLLVSSDSEYESSSSSGSDDDELSPTSTESSSPPSPGSTAGRARKYARVDEAGGRKRRTHRRRRRRSQRKGGKEKRVSFATNLISDVWTRPRTDPEDRHILFYSSEDESRFRQEYYSDTCLDQQDVAAPEVSDDSTSITLIPDEDSTLSVVDVDLIGDPLRDEVSSPTIDEMWDLPATPPSPPSSPPSFLEEDGKSSSDTLPFLRKSKSGDGVVTRAVVDYAGTTRTFYDSSYPQPPLSPTCVVEAASNALGKEVSVFSDEKPFDFDDPAFWNGTVTWY